MCERFRTMGLALLLACAWSGSRADDAGSATLKLGLAKGFATGFSVQRQSSSEGQGGQGEFRNQEESTIVYRLEVTDRKDNGDVTLKVTYQSVKAKQSGREQSWEFDSSSKEGGDEASEQIRSAMTQPITVQISGGKVREIAGFPEVARPEGGQRGDWRRWRAAGMVGRRGLERDLELILASAAQGQQLEKGKEYRPEERQEGEARAGGEGRQGRGAGRGGFFRGGEQRVSFKYEGSEKSEGGAAAKFVLASAPPPQRPEGEGGEGRRGPTNRKGEGTALVSLADGVLLKFEFSSEQSTEGERNGQSFKFSSKSKTTMVRMNSEKVEKAPKTETAEKSAGIKL